MTLIEELLKLKEDSERDNLEKVFQDVKQYGVTMEQLRVFDKINRTAPLPFKDDPDSEFIEI